MSGMADWPKNSKFLVAFWIVLSHSPINLRLGPFVVTFLDMYIMDLQSGLASFLVVLEI